MIAEKIEELRNRLESKFDAFKEIDKLAQNVYKVTNYYQGNVKKRINSINVMTELSNACYRAYADGVAAEMCKLAIKEGIDAIKTDVVNDHKKYGTGRFFKSWQKESTLIQAIDRALIMK